MNYSLSQVTAPTEEPITLDEAKAHLRVDLDDDDELIEGLITAARDMVETETGRALMSQTWDLRCDYGFPACFEIPKPPLISVDSITYVDSDGDTQTLATTEYTVDAPEGPDCWKGRIVPAYSITWPTTRSIINAVTVRFSCGYELAQDVPEPLKTAIKVMLAELYVRREESVTGTIINAVPFGLKALCMPYRVKGLAG